MLTAKKVTEVLEDCLYDEEPGDNAKIVEGVINNYAFNPDRLEVNKSKIADLLSDLPDEFKAASGGGWSFLNACNTKDGVQWGEHMNIEQLLALGIATEQAKIMLPRDMWSMFPGGMPYFSISVA